MRVEVQEDEPGRFTAVVTLAGGAGETTRHTVFVPAGVGVPGASDEALVETVIEVLCDAGHEVPTAFDVTQLLRRHPAVWGQVEARLDV